MFVFGIKDIIDIVCVALMLYYVYRLMKESRSLNVFIGIIVFVIIWLFVSQVLEMRLLGSIMDKLVSVGVLAHHNLPGGDTKVPLFARSTPAHEGAHETFLQWQQREEEYGQDGNNAYRDGMYQHEPW